MQCTNNLFWFRRDLRLFDNNGLSQALQNNSTICCFIWDINIIKHLDKDNPRVVFIENSLEKLKKILQDYGSDLIIIHGETRTQIEELVKKYNIGCVYFNEDYEPWAINRDQEIINNLATQINVKSIKHKDHVIFHKQEILNKEQRPYNVFSAYKKAWLSQLNEDNYQEYPSQNLLNNLVKLVPQETYFRPSSIGFNAKISLVGGENAAQERFNLFTTKIDNYHQTRDFPQLDKTSYLGVDLRFGTISIRQLVRFALSKQNAGADIWLSELIWRDFFSQILFNYPHVVDNAFNQKYKNLEYTNNRDWFIKWCNGETGYPIVDAAMRQLNQTGFMHNRLRMIVASFLCKDLLIDWRWGEKYFAQKLLDYDLASNNGNWQWCASTGCDAQPYFRIFNPYLQSQKFDDTGNFIRKYLPELAHLDNKKIHQPIIDIFSNLEYPQPIVEHKTQVEKAIVMFKNC